MAMNRGETNHNRKCIYVVLTDTGTWFTRLIRLFTRKTLNHASIAFDEELNEVYSFGRKQPYNPFVGGFVKENMRGALFVRADCAVYRCEVDMEQFRRMREIIHRFEKRASRFRYNLPGLVGVVINKPYRRSCFYFCSQFVATVFERSGIPIASKCAALTTPHDLAVSKRLQCIYNGPLQTYIARRRANRAPAEQTVAEMAVCQGTASKCTRFPEGSLVI